MPNPETSFSRISSLRGVPDASCGWMSYWPEEHMLRYGNGRVEACIAGDNNYWKLACSQVDMRWSTDL